MYGADMTAPGMLVGRILRSPHAHAEIVVDRHLGGRGYAGRQGRGHRAAISWRKTTPSCATFRKTAWP